MSVEVEADRFGVIDIEHFIFEIESRPSLWNVNHDDYCNKDMRRKCWEELVNIFLRKESATTAEKNEFSNLLQRKWKNLRDCYVRERQRLAKIKSGSCVRRKTQYVFYNQLSFLQKVTKCRETPSKTEEPAAEERPEIKQPSVSSAVPPVEPKKGKRKRVDDISSDTQCLVDVLMTSIQSREEREKRKEEDGDRLFLLSLLNPMKKIPEHLRLGVRMEIMQVIQNATPNNISDNMTPYDHQDH